MHTICLTRYNNATWEASCKWRANHAAATECTYKCIYKSPVPIRADIPYESPLFIIEMNNDTNQIMGIGRIINEIRADRNYSVHADQNYNRYTYLGRQHIDRNNMTPGVINIITRLERFLFRGARHCKRGQGINILPAHLQDNRLTNLFIRMFLRAYPRHNNSSQKTI